MTANSSQNPAAANFNEAFVRKLAVFQKAVGIGMIMVPGGVLWGWQTDNSALKSILPNIVVMNPVSAVNFILAAFSLLLLQPSVSLQWRRAGKFLASVVAFVGLTRLISYIFSFETGIDQIFFKAKLLGNHMAPNSAANFCMLGLSLFFADFETRHKLRPSQILILFVLFSSLLAFLGYVYGVKTFYEFSSFIPMALNTSICFILFSLAVFSLRPTDGNMQIIASNSMGGLLSRKLLPACILVPALLGLFGLLGQRYGFYDKEFRLVVVVVGNVIIFTVLVWWLANALHRTDLKRKEAEELIHKLSLTDELTGLFNRRGFQTLAEQQLKVAKREKTGFAIIFADLDGLKSINDTYGHAEGDRALVAVGSILKKLFRRSDILARFAGDEFAVLEIGTDLKQTEVFIEKLNQSVAAFNERKELSYSLSISAGVSYFRGENTTIDALMAEADRQLYSIKYAKRGK